MQLYRFALQKFVKDLSGEGAKLYGGRWNSKDNAMLYTAYSPSLAMLEFVCNAGNLARTKQTALLTLQLTAKVKTEILTVNDLPTDWQKVPSPDALKRIGDNWLKSGSTLMLKVPSAIIPFEHNCLINPMHKDFSKLIIEDIVALDIDNRILKLV